MIDLQTVKPGTTLRIPFSTFDKDDGSSITMTNYAVADILIYKDGNTTERASTAGFTATTDFDAKTGKHILVIDLADNTTADFFQAGSEYLVGIDAVTVDAVTVGGWVARFRIGYPAAILDTTIATLSSQTSFTLTTGPAEDDALNGLWAIIHDAASAVQWSWVIIDDYTGASKTVTLAAGATFTAAAKDNISIMFPAPLQPTTAGRKLDVAATGEAGLDFNNVLSTGLCTLHSLTITNAVSLGSTLSISGTVTLAAVNANTITTSGTTTFNAFTVTGSLTAGTNAIPWNAAWDAEVQSEADDAIVARFLDQLVSASGTSDSGSTTTMVDAARTEGDADYWKGQLIKFTSGNIAGQTAIITDFNAGTDTFTFAPATTQAVSTQTYVILPYVSTWDDTLAEHLTAGTTGNALNAAGSAGDPWATALPGAYGAGTAGRLVGRSLPDIVAGSAGGLFIAGSNAATTLATLTVSGATTLTGAVTATNGSNSISGVRLSATGVDDVWDELSSGHVAAGSFGQALYIVRSNTATAGGATSITLDGSASATNDFYNDDLIVITAGTGAGQARFISDYDGTTKVATVGTWVTNPSSDSVFVIIPSGGVSVPSAATISTAVWTEALPGAFASGAAGHIVGTALPDIAPGSTNGLLRGGTNTATTLSALTVTNAFTVSGATVHTGNVSMAAGLTITQSTTDGVGLSVAGNGTGAGVKFTGGATGSALNLVGGGTSGDGILITATSGNGIFSTGGGTNKYGMHLVGSEIGPSAYGLLCTGGATGGAGIGAGGTGTGTGFLAVAAGNGVAGIQGYGGPGDSHGILGKAGAGSINSAGICGFGWSGNAHGIWGKGIGTGAGLDIEGGATGPGMQITGGGTSGDGLLIDTTSGHGINITPVGTSKHGINVTGGNGGTSDAFKLTAGTGGVGFRSDTITISGATTFTGAVTASNASNAINLGTDMITSGVLAADAIGSAELSTAAVAKIFGTALTEAYRTAGSTGTAAQIMYELLAGLLDHSISGTTKTIRTIAGTAAKTYTLDSAVTPTSITETT